MSAWLLALSLLWACKQPEEVKLNVSWPDFLSRNDLVWTEMPTAWSEGAFTGNGIVGSIFWQEENSIHFEVSRTDAYDHRNGTSIYTSRYRLPNGAFKMEYAGEYQKGELRLDLWNAEANGKVVTDAGEIAIRTFTHASDEVILLEVETKGGEKLNLTWAADTCQTSRKTERGKPGTAPYPFQRLQVVDGVNVSVQDMPEDEKYNTQGRGEGQLATAWRIIDAGNGKNYVFISEKYSYPGTSAMKEAVDQVNRAAEEDLSAWINGHRDWWHDYYQKSFITLPNSRLESFYWIQLYKMASATRGDRPMIDLAGPWYKKDPQWPGIWWNLNVQCTYAPFFTANHVDEGSSLINWMWKYRENLEQNALGEGRYAIGRSCPITLERECNTAGYEVGNLGYALYNVWEQYRATMDDSLLKEQLYPLIRGHYRFFRDFYIEKRDDGKYHLKPSGSPEYTRAGYPPPPDCNYNLSILKWMTEALIYSNDRLSLNDPLIEEVNEINQNLADYPADPREGFMVGEGQPFAYSHRHWSHLFMIYPFYEYTYDNPEQGALIDKSLKHWLSYSEAYRGYSWLAAASMTAMKGDGATAVEYIFKSLDHNRFPALPNTMYLEAAPVIETPLLAARSIQDLILTSYNGVIRVFPAVPAEWSDLAFHDLRAEGAFLVSAKREDGATRFIRIESLAGERCRVKTGLAGEVKGLGSRPLHIIDLGQGVVEVDLKKGESAILYTGEIPDNLTIGQVAVQDQNNYWGSTAKRKKAS